jgi:hypothetical protein
MKIKRNVIQIWLLCMAMSGLAGAADFHVTNAQQLQNALTVAAADGAADNIYLAAGTYLGNFDYNSSESYDLTIEGEPGTATTNIIVNGAGAGRSLSMSCYAPANLTIQGITFIRNCGNGQNSWGALRCSTTNADVSISGCNFPLPANAYGMGIEIVSARNLTISNCTVTGNGLTGSGTGIYIDSPVGASNIVLIGNTFSGNTASYEEAGGLEIDNLDDYSCSVLLSDNTFTGNVSYFFAGGVDINGGQPTLNHNIFIGNSGDQGGGAYLANIYSPTTLNGNSFIGNICADGGAGVAADIASAVTFNNNSFIGNVASESGGGVYFYGDSLTMNGNMFNQNQSAYPNNQSYGFGGGGYFEAGDFLLLQNNVFVNNTNNTAFTGASSDEGGAFYVVASTTNYVVNNTVTGNSSSTGGGAAFDIYGLVEKIYVYNNIIWGNTASALGGDVYMAGTGAHREFSNNDVDDMFATWDLSVANIDADPLFVAPTNGNYHLSSNSPCINAGNIAYVQSAVDYDGNPRVTGTNVDMGAYELNTAPLHPILNSVGYLFGNQFEIQFNGVAGQNYTLQMSTNLASTNWTSILVTNAPGGSFSITDPNATNRAGFYRIWVGP